MSKKRRRVLMRKAKEIIRLNNEQGFSNRAIARACNISPATVSEYLDRASESNHDFATLCAMDDESLGRILYPEKAQMKSSKQMPDMDYLHKELKRKGVTLQLLWDEYNAAHPDGYKRSGVLLSI